MLASIGPLTSGCILCAHSCCNYPLSCRGVGGEALSSVSPLQRYGTKMAESDLWWLIVTWSEIKRRICFAPELPPPPQRDWERDALHPPCKSVKSVSSVLCHLYSVLCYLYSKKTLHLCLRITGRKILVSSRFVPRMESAVNMNEQAHDNMSASHGRCENGKVNEKYKGTSGSASK